MNRLPAAAVLSAAFAVSACAMTTDAPTGSGERRMGAGAQLRTSTGGDAGAATALLDGNRIRVRVDARGIAPGVHAVHVHSTGKCDTPDFTTAGPHWNPTGHQHGTENPAGPHAGDMPNFTIAADGTGTAEFTLASGTLEGLMDADGAAIVIHAGPDDYKTDPSGSSGGRIACGVLSAS